MRLNFGVRLSCASAVSKHNSDRRLRHVHHLLLLLPTGRRPAARRRHRSRRPRDPLSLLRRTLLLRPLGRQQYPTGEGVRRHRSDEPKLTRCSRDPTPTEYDRSPPASLCAPRGSAIADPSSGAAAHIATFSPAAAVPWPPDGRPEYDSGTPLSRYVRGRSGKGVVLAWSRLPHLRPCATFGGTGRAVPRSGAGSNVRNLLSACAAKPNVALQPTCGAPLRLGGELRRRRMRLNFGVRLLRFGQHDVDGLGVINTLAVLSTDDNVPSSGG
jgi:hypothetical protein